MAAVVVLGVLVLAARPVVVLRVPGADGATRISLDGVQTFRVYV